MEDEFKKSITDLAKAVMTNEDEQWAKALYEATVALCKMRGSDTSAYPLWDQLDASKKGFWLNMHQNNIKLAEDNP